MYDVVVGGGFAGACLAAIMAGRGAQVMVLERDTRFKDRVRGEALFPWGAAELQALGLRTCLLASGATEHRWWDDFLGSDQIGHRDTVQDTPGRTATATSDPSWGQGLSLSVRDVRLLRDALLANDDWDIAGRAYAAAHDRGYATIHATEQWFTSFFLEPGPEADARRARALPLIENEPERVPDAFMAGPEAAPATEAARRRFFGEA